MAEKAQNCSERSKSSLLLRVSCDVYSNSNNKTRQNILIQFYVYLIYLQVIFSFFEHYTDLVCAN